MNTWQRYCGACIVTGLCLAGATASSQTHKTVIGPSNIDLFAGAELLKSGDAEEGVRRTLIGLGYATTIREKAAGNSNACAGYVMLEQAEKALPYCDEALRLKEGHWRALTNRALAHMKLGQFEKAEADLRLAEEIAPGSRSVKLTRAMLLDATDPVAPHVIVDDRRQEPDNE